MLVITWDEAAVASSAGDGKADADGCCDEHVVNTPRAAGIGSDLSGVTSIVGSGGGRTGALVLSPFVRAGTVSTVPYNHYSLLRTVEDLFGLGHLGYAGQASGVVDFGADVFTASATPATAAKKPATTTSTKPANARANGPGGVSAPGGSLAATGSDATLPLVALVLLSAAGLVHAARRTRRGGARPPT
jgi:hypothetical protein